MAINHIRLRPGSAEALVAGAISKIDRHYFVEHPDQDCFIRTLIEGEFPDYVKHDNNGNRITQETHGVLVMKHGRDGQVRVVCGFTDSGKRNLAIAMTRTGLGFETGHILYVGEEARLLRDEVLAAGVKGILDVIDPPVGFGTGRSAVAS